VLVKQLKAIYTVSERRICLILARPRSSIRHKSINKHRAELRIRLSELAYACFHYGYRRLHILLIHDSWSGNHKLVNRNYKEGCLIMHPKNPDEIAVCEPVKSGL
jgi:hypothetical protein